MFNELQSGGGTKKRKRVKEEKDRKACLSTQCKRTPLLPLAPSLTWLRAKGTAIFVEDQSVAKIALVSFA